MKFFKSSSGVKFWMEKVGEQVWVYFKGRTFTLSGKTVELADQKTAHIQQKPYLVSPIVGRVLSIKAREGGLVQKGDTLIVIESMKIEHALVSVQSVKIKSILVKEGQSVEANEKLMTFD